MLGRAGFCFSFGLCLAGQCHSRDGVQQLRDGCCEVQGKASDVRGKGMQHLQAAQQAVQQAGVSPGSLPERATCTAWPDAILV